MLPQSTALLTSCYTFLATGKLLKIMSCHSLPGLVIMGKHQIPWGRTARSKEALHPPPNYYYTHNVSSFWSEEWHPSSRTQQFQSCDTVHIHLEDNGNTKHSQISDRWLRTSFYCTCISGLATLEYIPHNPFRSKYYRNVLHHITHNIYSKPLVLQDLFLLTGRTSTHIVALRITVIHNVGPSS